MTKLKRVKATQINGKIVQPVSYDRMSGVGVYKEGARLYVCQGATVLFHLTMTNSFMGDPKVEPSRTYRSPPKPLHNPNK